MNSILHYCNKKCNNVEYNKLVTGGNDPTITKAMMYSHKMARYDRTTCSYAYVEQVLVPRRTLSINNVIKNCGCV